MEFSSNNKIIIIKIINGFKKNCILIIILLVLVFYVLERHIAEGKICFLQNIDSNIHFLAQIVKLYIPQIMSVD